LKGEEGRRISAEMRSRCTGINREEEREEDSGSKGE